MALFIDQIKCGPVLIFVSPPGCAIVILGDGILYVKAGDGILHVL